MFRYDIKRALSRRPCSFSVETALTVWLQLRIPSFVHDAPRIHKLTKAKQTIAKRTFSDFSNTKRLIFYPKLSSQSCAVISKKKKIKNRPVLSFFLLLGKKKEKKKKSGWPLRGLKVSENKRMSTIQPIAASTFPLGEFSFCSCWFPEKKGYFEQTRV